MRLLLALIAMVPVAMLLASPWFWRQVSLATRNRRWYQGLPCDVETRQ